MIARLPVTPKHQRISLTPALPSRTVSSVTEEHIRKSMTSPQPLCSFETGPLLNIYVLLHYTQPKHVHHPKENPSPTTLIHTIKNDITSKGHSWHLTTRWPFCISSLEVPPQVGGWQLAKVVAAKLRIRMEMFRWRFRTPKEKTLEIKSTSFRLPPPYIPVFEAECKWFPSRPHPPRTRS